MVQGTTSDAGKSTLVTALCRILHQRHHKVAPFKPQNMALNSAVTADGHEIGRAQAVQAQAAGIEPSVHMNPILLKPNTDIGAQVILQGKAVGNMDATSYHDYKSIAKETALDSYEQLSNAFDTIIIEGAGSPAEINLRDRDIANMGFAEAIDCPVIIIADIDKGGVFAHLVGTLDLLSQSEQNRVIGFVINRFRGDISLLQSGLDWLEKRTGKPVFGVLPYLHGFHLESEDAITQTAKASNEHTLHVVIPIIPRTSNHTDWDALRLHPNVTVSLIGMNQSIPPCDLVILPGSKSVQSDLAFLKQQGWQGYLDRHLRYGGKVMGICGGFQMLGETLSDPLGLENAEIDSQATGFGYIPMTTVLGEEKQLKRRQGTLIGLCLPEDTAAQVTGYEIHAGISTYLNNSDHKAFAKIEDIDSDNQSLEGYVSSDNQIIGTYLHGCFDHPEALSALIEWAGAEHSDIFDYPTYREQQIQRLADSVNEHLNMDTLVAHCQAFKEGR